MKFTVLVPEVVEIPAETVEEIFQSVVDDFHDGDLRVAIHFEDVLLRAESRHGVALPENYKFDGDADNKITLRAIKAAKRKEARR
jgi:hypothetical protein